METHVAVLCVVDGNVGENPGECGGVGVPRGVRPRVHQVRAVGVPPFLVWRQQVGNRSDSLQQPVLEKDGLTKHIDRCLK